MTTTNFTDDVIIDGSRNVRQLVVQANPPSTGGQTTPLQDWQDSAGNSVAQITGDGRLQVGDDAGAPDALVEVHRDDDSVNKPKRGIHTLGRIAGALSEIVQWSVHELELVGSGVISTLQTALRVRLTHNNSANSSASGEFRAADIEAIQQQGQINTLTAIRAAVSKSGGTVTNAYGVKVEDVEAGSTNYALHTGKGIVRVGDTFEVKAPASVPGTPSTDIIRLYPKSSDPNLYAKNSDGNEFKLNSFFQIVPRTVLGSSATVVEITIPSPSVAKHLLLMGEMRSDHTVFLASVRAYFSDDQTQSYYYSSSRLSGDTTDLPYDFPATLNPGGILLVGGANGANATSDYFSIWTLTIFNYADATSRPKCCLWQGYAQNGNAQDSLYKLQGGGLWKKPTTAITSIKLAPYGGSNFVAGSAYALYGFN